jgi:hypothetical protein
VTSYVYYTFLNFAFAAMNGSLALGFWHKTSLIGLYLVSWVVVPAIACGTPAIAVFAAGAVLIGYSFSHHTPRRCLRATHSSTCASQMMVGAYSKRGVARQS